MNVVTFLWIIVWFFAILFVAGILLIVFLFGRSSKEDNPNLASIFINKGLHCEKPVKGILHRKGKKGESFKYGQGNIVMIPNEYKRRYYNNKRMVFVEHKGQIIASPFDNDVPITESQAEDLIYDICESHVVSDGLRALRGKSAVKLMSVIVIVVIIACVGVFGYNYLSKQQSTQQNTPIEQPANNKLNEPIEVK